MKVSESKYNRVTVCSQNSTVFQILAARENVGYNFSFCLILKNLVNLLFSHLSVLSDLVFYLISGFDKNRLVLSTSPSEQVSSKKNKLVVS